MDSDMTGGGAGEYIPPDDILDRVASLLGSTVTRFTVPFGGDRAPEEFVGVDAEEGDGLYVDARVLPVNNTVDLEGGTIPVLSSDYEVVADLELIEDSQALTKTPDKPKKLTFNTPRAGTKKRKLNDDVGAKTARNYAIAEYYIAKKKCMEANKDIRLENQKLKVEKQKLLLEIEKLKFELSKRNV